MPNGLIPDRIKMI